MGVSPQELIVSMCKVFVNLHFIVATCRDIEARKRRQHIWLAYKCTEAWHPPSKFIFLPKSSVIFESVNVKEHSHVTIER